MGIGLFYITKRFLDGSIDNYFLILFVCIIIIYGLLWKFKRKDKDFYIMDIATFMLLINGMPPYIFYRYINDYGIHDHRLIYIISYGGICYVLTMIIVNIAAILFVIKRIGANYQ